MKKQYFMKNTFIILLTAMLTICAAVLATIVFVGTSNAYAAETTAPYDAPLAYTYTAGSEGAEGYYTVTGVDKAHVDSLSGNDKKNLKITIPAEYDDGTGNGKAPVKAIGEKAFSEYTSQSDFINPNNEGLNFVEVDLSQATNLETIGKAAFIYCTSQQELTLPAKVKIVFENAFYRSNFEDIVFNEELEQIHHSAFVNMPMYNSIVNIPAKTKIVKQDGSQLLSNIFYKSPIKAFTVDEKNEYYKAVDGVLYTKDGKTLIAYPGGKEDVDVFRVPTEVTNLAERCFQEIKNITSTIVLPDTVVAAGMFTLYDIAADVYLKGDSSLKKEWPYNNFIAQANSDNVIYAIFDTEADKTAFLLNTGIDEEIYGKQMLVLESISADFDKTAEGTIPTGATAEDLKKHFTVKGNAEKDITVPIDNFALELPTTGLVKGNNTVAISYRDFSTTHNIPVGITPAAPAAPVVSGKPTANSITLTEIAGAEYSCNGGVTWQDSPIFTGLEANTEYTFLARIKATDTENASPASVVLTIKTAPSEKGGLLGGAVAGIVIGCILVVGILALLALFIFRKDKSIGFKEYYMALGGACVTTVKGWGGKINGKIKKLLNKESAEDPTVTLPEESGADQVSETESDDKDAEPKD